MSPASCSKRVFTLILGGLISLAVASPAVAQREERKTKQTVAMSQSVFEKLQEIQELVEAMDYAGGHRGIQELQAKKKLSPYEKAQLHNLDGYTYYLEESKDNVFRM
jgi:hypothetical protein